MISFALTTIAIAFLAYSLPIWENILFPGLHKIDPLQRDLTILEAKFEHLNQSLQNSQDKSTDIESLKDQISSLQQTVDSLVKESSKPLSGALIEPSNQSITVQQTALETNSQEIKDSHAVEEKTIVPQPNNWWNSIWNYLSKWISVRHASESEK